jgi:hypothetical protein
MRRHNLTSADLSVRGGVLGSWPFWGEYGRLKVLNWATKFFVDALLLEIQQDGLAVSSVPPADPTSRLAI